MRILALGAFLSLGLSDVAAPQSFVPARLSSLADKEDLTCPADEPRTVIFCQAVVEESGAVASVQGTSCFADKRSDSRRAEVLRSKVLQSEFAPARIDGVPVKVHLSFRAFFLKDGDACNVVVVPNLGYQYDELGLDFFAPQEIHTDGGWIESIPIRNRNWGGERGFIVREGVAFVMSVAVDELGRASDGNVELNAFAPESSVQLAVQALEQSRFIPAFVEGRPHSARYFELMHVQDP